MGKKVKFLPFFSKPTNALEESPPPPPLWPWPTYCQQPRTLSFRDINDTTFKTAINTTTSLEDDDDDHQVVEVMIRGARGGDPVEEMIKGLMRSSERLFFEPEETSSILEEANNKQQLALGLGGGGVLPFKESVAMSIESRDPYLDFKKSMEEMVEAHGLKDSWEELQELLCCYLRVNGKCNHGYILGAFVDLLVGFAFASSSSSSSSSSKTTTTTNPSSSSCTSTSSRVNHECPCSCSRNISPSSPLSFYTSSSSSFSSSFDQCSSGSNPCVSNSSVLGLAEEMSDVSPCLSLVGVDIAILEEEEEES